MDEIPSKKRKKSSSISKQKKIRMSAKWKQLNFAPIEKERQRTNEDYEI